MITEKKNYMKQLRRLLLWEYSATATKEILEDYEEFFCEGKLSGKSEKDICESLGDPKFVIEELKNESERKESEKSNSRLILRGGLVCMILVFGSIMSMLISYRPYYIYFMMAALPLLMLFLWGILDGRSLMASQERSYANMKTGIFAGLGFIIFVSYIFAYIMSNLYSSLYVQGMLRYGLEGIFSEPANLKPADGNAQTYSLGCFLIMIFLIILMGALIILIRKKSVSYFGLLFLVIGIWGDMLIYCNIFSDYLGFLSVQSDQRADINIMLLLVAAECIVCALVFWGISRYFAYKQKKLN